MSPVIELCDATAGDAPALSVLATHVYVHTYCEGGLRPDQAREALVQYSVAEFERRLASGHRIVLALQGERLLAFADTVLADQAPQPDLRGVLELSRLYVAPQAQRLGVGRLLIRHAEQQARALGCGRLWLTAWAENANALGFYRRLGFVDVGRSDYVFEDQVYENRVLVKGLEPGG
jgi:ribosomal protein S18 acetylase RimI-like enzyme